MNFKEWLILLRSIALNGSLIASVADDEGAYMTLHENHPTAGVLLFRGRVLYRCLRWRLDMLHPSGERLR